MELSEATALAGTFVTSLLFKVQSLPLNERTGRALEWWREQRSRVPLRVALQEKRRHLAQFSSRRWSERQNERELYLEISAIVEDYGDAKCPVLSNGLCGIYEDRPLTCRTVPLHYSRQPSVLKSYIDKFAGTPGYECNTSTSPVILAGNSIISEELRHYRGLAVALSKADRKWKSHILSYMDDPIEADRAGLPTYDTVLNHSDNGYATLLPMMVGWRVAESVGIISPTELTSICARQSKLIEAEIKRLPSAVGLRELLPLYEAGALGTGRLAKAAAFAGSATA